MPIVREPRTELERVAKNIVANLVYTCGDKTRGVSIELQNMLVIPLQRRWCFIFHVHGIHNRKLPYRVEMTAVGSRQFGRVVDGLLALLRTVRHDIETALAEQEKLA